MSTMHAIDFLTKELTVDRNLVTYRGLSRELGVHVNEAKNELATFYESSKTSSNPIFATYLVSGPPKRDPFFSQDTEMLGVEDELIEYIDKTKVVLMTEDELMNCDEIFETVTSKHIYSLSPAQIHDAGLLCTLTDRVRTLDKQNGITFVKSSGKIIGSNVTRGRIATLGARPFGSTSKDNKQPTKAPPTVRKVEPENKTVAPTKPVVPAKPVAPTTAKPREVKAPLKTPVPAPAPEKKKGTLDWSKAKPKGANEKGKEAKKKEVKDEDVEMEETNTEAPKRGLKRKSEIMAADTEDAPPVEAPTNEASSGARLRRNVVLSDDDEDDDVPIGKKGSGRISKAKSRALPDSDDEGGAHALMDIDEGDVVKASSSKIGADAPATNYDGGDDAEPQDDEMQVDEPIDDIKPLPRKKKVKKVVPVGKNGLKKKRVVKNRMTTDSKGFTIFEDYSEYESVDEESPEEPKASKKGKAKGKSEAEPPAKPTPAPKVAESSKPRKSGGGASTSSSTTKAKAAPAAKPKGGQKSMTSFFGKKA